ncbi:MAG: hypothetical protein NZL85_08485, partial [Fimbriimonadales bacterium]|nr:hypothetical protein [Fimbriimonadales bacterium]
MALEGLALVAFQRAQRIEAGRWLQEAFTLRQTYGLPLAPVDQPVLMPLCQALEIDSGYSLQGVSGILQVDE